jgi:PEP-CTERM motif
MEAKMNMTPRIAIALLVAMSITGVAHAEVILLDLGDASGAAAGNWNVFTDYHDDGRAGSYVTDAIDSDGNATAIDITITDRFSHDWNVGGIGSTLYPDAAANDGLRGYDQYQPTNQVTISDLDLTKSYDLTFYAAFAASSGVYETQFTVAGGLATGGTVYLDGRSNTSSTVSVLGVQPTVAGEITVDTQKGPNNTATEGSSTGIYYFNVMEISVVPEPLTMALLALGGFYAALRRKA